MQRKLVNIQSPVDNYWHTIGNIMNLKNTFDFNVLRICNKICVHPLELCSSSTDVIVNIVVIRHLVII